MSDRSTATHNARALGLHPDDAPTRDVGASPPTRTARPTLARAQAKIAQRVQAMADERAAKVGARVRAQADEPTVPPGPGVAVPAWLQAQRADRPQDVDITVCSLPNTGSEGGVAGRIADAQLDPSHYLISATNKCLYQGLKGGVARSTLCAAYAARVLPHTFPGPPSGPLAHCAQPAHPTEETPGQPEHGPTAPLVQGGTPALPVSYGERVANTAAQLDHVLHSLAASSAPHGATVAQQPGPASIPPTVVAPLPAGLRMAATVAPYHTACDPAPPRASAATEPVNAALAALLGEPLLDVGGSGVYGTPTPDFASGVGGLENPEMQNVDANSISMASVPMMVRGAPEAVRVALDSGAWVGEHLQDPGTPHRNVEGYPTHPRSRAALDRLGIRVYTGVDLAVQKHSAADFTVLFTIAVYPPHGPHGHCARRVLEIQRGKWYALDICKRVVDAHVRFNSQVILENNQAQDYIRQMIVQGAAGWDVEKDEADPARNWLRGYTTGRQKANPDFGVEALAAEFAREQWIFPTTGFDAKGTPQLSTEMEECWNEILYYDPASHTGDILMAMWLAKEGARMDETFEEPEQYSIGLRSF